MSDLRETIRRDWDSIPTVVEIGGRLFRGQIGPLVEYKPKAVDGDKLRRAFETMRSAT